MLPVIVVASLVALLCGIAHFVLRALHLRRIQTAEAYQAACREAVQLLRRYAPKSGGKDRQFDLTQVPLELRQTLLDGLQILPGYRGLIATRALFCQRTVQCDWLQPRSKCSDGELFASRDLLELGYGLLPQPLARRLISPMSDPVQASVVGVNRQYQSPSATRVMRSTRALPS